VREDLFREGAAPKGWADLVISNPPYIPSAEVDKLEPEVLKEPRLALDGGPDGLAAVRALIAQAPAFLKPGGWLVLEIGHDQGPAALKLLAAQGLSDAVVRKDLQGQDRIAVARRPLK
jgi:release factor glutamine methyltransferase